MENDPKNSGPLPDDVEVKQPPYPERRSVHRVAARRGSAEDFIPKDVLER